MTSEIEKVLLESLPVYSILPAASKAVLCSAVLRYSFRFINSSQLSETLKETHPDINPKKVRLALLSNGRVLKNIKLYTYISAQYSGIPGKLYDVTPRDERIIRHRLAHDEKLLKFLKSLLRRGYTPLTPVKMDKLVNDVISGPEFTTYIGKFVNHKHRFVIQTTGIKAADITQDLCSWGTYALYKAYPKMESFLHAINIAKTAAHNRGQNIIKEATSQSRDRLIKNDDGTFSGKNIPIHTMLTPSGDKTVLSQCNHMVVNLTGASVNNILVGDVQKDIELKMSIRMVYNRLPPRLQHLMRLWAGKYDSEFSTTLGEDNDEMCEQLPRKEYILKCVDYLKIPRNLAHNFYKTLQKQFQAYK